VAKTTPEFPDAERQGIAQTWKFDFENVFNTEASSAPDVSGSQVTGAHGGWQWQLNIKERERQKNEDDERGKGKRRTKARFN
jgi:hypothetical protein